MGGIASGGTGRGFRRAVLAESPGLRRRERQMLIASILLLLLVVPMLGAITVFAFWVWLTGYTPEGRDPEPPIVGFLMAAGASTVTLLVIAAPISGWIAVAREWRGRRRIAEFAERTGWHYIAEPPLSNFGALLFRVGNRARVEDSLHWHGERYLEVANYSYSTSQLENPRTRVGFVRIELPRRLPHMYLQSRTWTGRPNAIRIPFGAHQRLSLEGDFDQHFTLYCPSGYEADALYLFTPDIMARFIDHAAQLDVEIVDDWLFLYASREASTLDATTWAWLFGAVDALMTKLDQWGRWRDERLIATHTASAAGTSPMQMADGTALPFAAPAGAFAPPPGVAPQGRRLKQSVPWVLFILFGLVAAFGLISHFF